jgi:hypothetical protein
MANVPINHWAIPREIWKVMEAEKEEEKRGHLLKKGAQQQLNFPVVKGPYTEFTRAGTLHAVTKLTAVNNQVSCYIVKPKCLLNLPSPWHLRTTLPSAMLLSP